MLSSGKKRYLFIIHELGQNGNAVHSKDIASSLSVKQPSVSKMLNSLAEDGLIEKEYYGAATFTPEGARLSNKLYTDYLSFGISWDCPSRIPAMTRSFVCATCPTPVYNAWLPPCWTVKGPNKSNHKSFPILYM